MKNPPRTRVVLLGASNLTLAFPLVVSRLRAALPGPLEILAAIGHGRSYGRPSRVLLRELPGILECGLWRALDERPRGETVALLSDFGNDLLYGTEADEVAGWVERILEHLAGHGARGALVRLPLPNVQRISPLRFRIARGILYPSRRIDLATLRDRTLALDRRMVALARSRALALVEQRPEWYGVDPVHIRPGRRAEAWGAILSPLIAPGNAPGTDAPVEGLPRLRPERRRWMGRLELRGQPCAELLDGTTISVY